MHRSCPSLVESCLGHIGMLLNEIQSHVEMLPGVLPVVRRQLPRPRFMRACLDIAFAPNSFLRHWANNNQDAYGSIPTIRGAWMWLDVIDQRSRVVGHCMKRGCKKWRHGRCKSCHTVDYCSVECQAQSVFAFCHFRVRHLIAPSQRLARASIDMWFQGYTRTKKSRDTQC